jgi:hypothetical protein
MAFLTCEWCGGNITPNLPGQTPYAIVTKKAGSDNYGNITYSDVYWHPGCFLKYVLKNVFIDRTLTTIQSEFGINKKYSGAKDNFKNLAEFLSYLIMAYQSMKSDYNVEEACKTLKETANKLRAEGNKKDAEKIEKAMKGMCERFL